MKNIYYKISSKLTKQPQEVKKYTKERWLIYMLIPTIIMLFLTVLVLKGSIYTKEESIIGYNELGNIDYKVYLKDNNYYQNEYLGKDMQYIASLIKSIQTKFNYEMHTQEKLNYTYTYKVTADLIITDPNDNNKVLYKKPTVLVKEETKTKKTASFRVDKDASINYDEYNNYVNAFKKEYALSINSKLVLTFQIDITGKSKSLKEDFKKTNKLLISIPMSEQTISIGIDTSDINNSGTLEKNYMSQVKKPVALILGIIVGLLSLILLYIVIYTYITNRTKKDIYKSTIKSILKEYDRAIVTSKTRQTIDETKYNIIEVPRIEDLLDAHDSTGKPILYSEPIENEVSNFIIVSDDIIYKFVITREDLEKDEQERIDIKNEKIAKYIEKMNFLNKKEEGQKNTKNDNTSISHKESSSLPDDIVVETPSKEEREINEVGHLEDNTSHDEVI